MPGLPTRVLPVFLVLVGIVGTLAAACGGGQESSPEKLIPDGSNLIAHVNVTGLLASDGLLSLVSDATEDLEEPLNVDDILQEALSETGIDIRQFSQAVLFADTGRGEEFAAVIAKGVFDELALISSLRNAVEGRLVSAPYKDNLIYSVEDNSDTPSISILEDGILLAGTAEAVRAVIEVQQGDRERVSGALIEAFNDLGGGVLRLEAAVPADLLAESLPFLSASIPFLGDSLSGEGAGGLFGAVESLGDLELVGLTLAQNGQIFILRANLDFANEESAESIRGLLSGLITLGSSLSPSPEITELLGKLEVARRDDQVSIRLEMDGPEFAGLLSNLITPTQSERSVVQQEAPRIPRVIGQGDGTQAPQPVPQISAVGDKFPIMQSSIHVPTGESVAYITIPPTSGDHWERWAECGFYPEGLPDEIITHNLEHGNIVVSYNLPLEGQAARLRSVIENISLSVNWGVTRFYDKIPEGWIAISAWGRLYGIGAIDPVSMEAFFTLYAGELGPERIPC